MKAVTQHAFGGPEVLEIRELPVPAVREGWSLVQVKGTGLNRSELRTRQGHSPNVTFPRVLGIEELSAEIARLGRLEPDVVDDVIDEFYALATTKHAGAGGLAYARELLEASLGHERATLILDRVLDRSVGGFLIGRADVATDKIIQALDLFGRKFIEAGVFKRLPGLLQEQPGLLHADRLPHGDHRLLGGKQRILHHGDHRVGTGDVRVL